MKVVFLGTPNFVVPVLNELCQKHEVLAVFCQPDKPGNRGKIAVSPVKEFAGKNGIQVFTPNKIDEQVIESVKNLKPDVMVCCAYGKILPQAFIDICPILNIHPSDLPKYRGSSPVQWALINGETQIAVSVMHLCFKMDAGDVLAKKMIEVKNDDNAQTLLEKSFNLGKDLLIEVLENLDFYLKNAQKQDETQATVFPMLTKEDGKIDFSKSAKQVENLVRGLYMWPVAHAQLNGKNFKIFSAEAVLENEKNSEIGKVTSCGKDGIFVSCAAGFIKLKEVQIEGGKRMKAGDFCNGNQIKVGDKLC